MTDCLQSEYEVTYLFPVTLRVRAGNQADAEFEAARELCNLKVSGVFVDFSVGFPERTKVTEVNAVSREATEV